jgi:hypothetical protein
MFYWLGNEVSLVPSLRTSIGDIGSATRGLWYLPRGRFIRLQPCHNPASSHWHAGAQGKTAFLLNSASCRESIGGKRAAVIIKQAPLLVLRHSGWWDCAWQAVLPTIARVGHAFYQTANDNNG